MFTDKYYPDRIAAESLDTYLEKGWYRMGQSIFTTHFLSFDRRFYSAIWIRLPLNNYVFSKRLRKLCRRNEELFRYEYGPMRLDEEKETLTKFLSKNPMPWTSWWNGHDSGILVDWDVTYFPTIYVLDAQGVIRFKDLRGEKLEEAVNELLHELESAN